MRIKLKICLKNLKIIISKIDKKKQKNLIYHRRQLIGMKKVTIVLKIILLKTIEKEVFINQKVIVNMRKNFYSINQKIIEVN